MPDLVVAFVIFLLARGVIALGRPVFARVRLPVRAAAGSMPTRRARPSSSFRVGVVLFALVMAYPYLPGSGSEAFKGVSVLIGLMLTLGGSSVVGQAVSGLILMYSRALRVGEYVRIDAHEGTVTELGTFTTSMRTGMGEELTLPNTLVLGTVTKNYSRTVRKGRASSSIPRSTIGYDTPWRQVEAMLIEAARGTPGILADPAPRVFQTALTDFYRRVPPGLPGQPDRSATARRSAERAARPDPGRVQRARRADHVAALPRRPGRRQGRPAPRLVQATGAASRTTQEAPAAARRDRPSTWR